MPSATTKGIRIAIDRGGTFSDFWARVPGHQEDVVFKLLSVCPDEYPDAPSEGVRRILEIATGKAIPRGEALDLSEVEACQVHGPTPQQDTPLQNHSFLVTWSLLLDLPIANSLLALALHWQCEGHRSYME